MMMSVADNIFQKDSSSWHRAYPFRICFKLHILHLAKARHSTFVTIVTKYPMGSCQFDERFEKDVLLASGEVDLEVWNPSRCCVLVL